MKNPKIFIACLILLTLISCNGCHKNKSREKPDVSAIKVDVRLLRFDLDLLEFNKKDFNQQAAIMKSKYGAFFDFYLSQFIVGPRPAGDTTHIEEEALRKFLADAYIRRLQDSINTHFVDTKDVEEDLTQSFKYFKYYFPQATIPKVIAVNSGFSVGAFTFDKDMLGIGLDLYLGPGNRDYDSAGIFQYLQHKMRREYIARNSAEVLYNLYFGEEELSHGKTLLEAMADRGKKMFFLSLVLPDVPDDMIAGFTPQQTKWCEQNEYEIWKFMNDKDLLYKDNAMDQKRYLDEGPTIPGMPPESPGNIGNWIGLQIVRKFMKETGGKISLQDLIIKYDAKAILDKAKYRPSKSVF